MRKNLGEKEILRIEASSRLGDGNLYITSVAVAYEVNTMGLYMNFIPHEIIQSIRSSGNPLFGAKKFNIVWSENDTIHTFEIRTKKYKLLLTTLDELSLNG